MTKQEIIDYMYENHVQGDFKIEEMAEDLAHPQWIPVSKKLPEICEKDVYGRVTFSKQVWACQKYGDGFLWQAIDQYSSFGCWLSEHPVDDPLERCEVIAWMPLPEPWKEVKE